MKVLNASGYPLTGAVYAEAQRMLRAGRKAGAVPGGEGVLFVLIAKAGQVVVVNGATFRIVSADGTTVRWAGGVPPFTVSVERGDLPATFANVDQSVYTLTEREFSVLTKHQKELVDDDYDWWAANDELVDGEAVQTSVGVVIEDSSDTPKRLFAPFGGIEGVYTHFGPETWCVPVIVWPVPSSGTYGSVSVPAAHVYVPGDDTTPLPGTFTYDPPLGTTLGAGVHTVSVAFNAIDEIHYREATAQRVVALAKANQTITGFALNGDGYFTSAHTLSAAASSGLPVSFICYASEVVIDYNTSPPTITFPQPGTYTVYATQAGNSNWNMATQQEITRFITSHMPDANMTVTAPSGWGVGKTVEYHDTTPTHPDGATITLSWAVTQRPGGSTAQLSFYDPTHANFTDGTARGSYADLTPDVAGTYTVQLTATDQWGVSKTVSNTFSVVVVQPQTIAFDVRPNPLAVGALADVIITNSGTSTGTWAVGSDDWGVAEPLTGYKIRGIGAGSTVITLWKQSTDPAYSDAYATLSLSVQAVTALTTTVTAQMQIAISGGTPPYSAQLVGGTGGVSISMFPDSTHVTVYDFNVVTHTYGCRCPGSGVKVTDSVGATVTATFDSSFGPAAICTSGCPGGSGGGDPDWGTPVWTTTRLNSTASWYLYSVDHGWPWLHIDGSCGGPYSGSWYPPQASDSTDPWNLYPETAISGDGNYKIEFAYFAGSINDYNTLPGSSLAEMNAATGLNFSASSFGLCANSGSYVLRIKRLYAK